MYMEVDQKKYAFIIKPNLAQILLGYCTIIANRNI